MKKSTIILCAGLAAVARPLYADISNTNSVVWNGDINAVNTGYNWTGSPNDALNLQVTVNSGYQFDFSSLQIFLGYSGAGTGGAPSPILKIVDALNNTVATASAGMLSTPVQGFYQINSYGEAQPYDVTLAPSAPIDLAAGIYTFEIWDTGEQLQYMATGGAIQASGVSVTAGIPEPTGSMTPAIAIADVVVTVPEPSLVALAGLGGFSLWWLRRRR